MDLKRKADEISARREKVVNKISAILVKYAELTKEEAALIAEMAADYTGGILKLPEKPFMERYWQQIRTAILGIFLLLVGTAGIYGLYYIGGWGVNFIAWLTSSYPKSYRIYDEKFRFEYNEKLLGDIKLHKNCVPGEQNTWSTNKMCVRPQIIPSINNAMDEAVNNESEGLIWEGRNGNGEYWRIHRNNYRFIIYAEKDEKFID